MRRNVRSRRRPSTAFVLFPSVAQNFPNEEIDVDAVTLKKYAAAHYPDMCMQFPSELYWQINTVARYLEKKDMSVAKYYAEKTISLIRSQAGMGKTACNSQRLRAFYTQNGKVSK